MKPPLDDAHTEIVYESTDLELFSKAINWKKYWSEQIRSYLKGSVIEVGAGIGSSTKYLCQEQHPEWICLEPDPVNASTIAQRIASHELPEFCKAKCGILSDLPFEMAADTIIYIDVLEHIEEDEAEMREASARLSQGGHVIVLSPAFNCLYSPFDKAVGHYRRYGMNDVTRLTAPGMSVDKVFFLDSIGFLASLTNRFLLKSTMPTPNQIALWDRLMIPTSRLADQLFGAVFGKSIVVVWKKS